MAGISIEQASDLIVTTTPKFGKRVITDTQAYNDYVFLRNLVAPKMNSQGGTRFQQTIRLREGAPSRGVDLYEGTPNVRVNVTGYMLAEWTHHEGKVHYDARELMMNSDSEAQIVNWFQTQIDGEFEAICNWWEGNSMLCPNSSTDRKNPLGLAYWINPLASGVTDTAGGFNGTTATFRNATTTTVIGGIDASNPDNSRWRNWVATYTSMSPLTIKSIVKALRRTKFVPPPQLSNGQMLSSKRDRLILMDQNNYEDYEEIVNSGSDPRKGDARPFGDDDAVPLRGVDVLTTPSLDTIAIRPIYILNKKSVKIVTLNNTWMTKGKAVNDRDALNVYTQGIDTSAQIVCTNRRAQAVLHNTY